MADEVIGGYKLLNCILTGQNSQVWEVVEVSSHRHFAMKILLEKSAKKSDVRSLLFHEADVGKELTHGNVIKIVHVSPTKEPVPYFVMEFFPAGSVKQRLMRKQFDFVKEHAHSIVKQAATALAYMNASGWVHRDVKPDNMLVNSAGDLRIIDFALARRIDSTTLMARLKRRIMGKGPVQGTRSYMSPEQIRNMPLDGRADIYSFGASVYEIVTHHAPFRAATNQLLLQKHILEKPEPPDQHARDLTPEFSKLVMHMLAKKPADRPQNFHEVLKVLNMVRVYKTDPFRKK
jgi:eukaryotic-like serine/threonine-protein kinase